MNRGIATILIAIGSLGCHLESTDARQNDQGDSSISKAEGATLPGKVRVDKPFDFDKHGGVVYRQGTGFSLSCDVYVPHGDGPYPSVLAVHGGGWRGGSKLNWFRHARKIARAGFVVVAINYRHAPRYKFPAQIHDCKAAVRWMRANADKYKIDSLRIGAIGYSAGGHLVALLGTTDKNDNLEGPVNGLDVGISTRVKAVAAGGAPLEFSWIQDDSQTLAYWLGGSRQQKPEIYRQASPLTYISPDDPPIYLFHGASDQVVPPSNSQNMYQALQDHQLASDLKIWPGYGHFTLFLNLDAFEPPIDFLKRHLK